MGRVDWDNAVSVVTGAGSGIGRSIAQSMASRGARVVVTDIEADAAEAVATEIRAAGGTAIAVQVDVADYDAVAALADRAYAEYGRVDVLCNNAGVTMRPYRAVWDASAADFTWMMQINYFGVVNGLLAFVPRMRAQSGHKHIVNTSSMATLDEVPGHGMYTASKAAVDGISDVLRAELIDQGDDFGVTVLYPGQVTTRIATSERLRAAGERSDARQVKAYERRSEPKTHALPLDPDVVGDMVIHAIDNDLRYCLTHPAPAEELRARTEAWIAGHVPATATTG
ncbi:SDR family NAD(P)-dependent oxidoreductase [Streptosporangium sp. NPDC087985]|uniref:SDR family NAD(P)-dependent oxidoreductase n=1 Tax=Streptosporangium sp. NPDC087985 TaxID=3366196 RepID=UPI003808AED2